MTKKKAKAAPEKTADDIQRDFWRTNGGEFHGPNVETGSMPEAKLLPLLRDLRKETVVQWGPPLPGSILGEARVLYVNGAPSGKYESWEEDLSLRSIDKVLRHLASANAITYNRVKEEWEKYANG